MGRFFFFAGLALVSAILVSCQTSSRATEEPRVASKPTQALQVYQATGLVVSVSLEKREVEIKHEAIAGYMPAMTMPFTVKNTNELTGLKPGENVRFRLWVTETDGSIDQLQNNGAPQTNVVADQNLIHIVPNVDPLLPGDLFPEHHLTNQFGKAFTTGLFKGKALAVTFLFTRCPFPTFCPLMASRFAEAQQQLLALKNGPTNWHLLTISFDPEFDTPTVLKAYAQAHQYEPEHSTFATGSLAEITAIADSFGLTFWRDQGSGLSHNLRTVVIDAGGRVQKIFQGNTWTTDELTSELIAAAKKS